MNKRRTTTELSGANEAGNAMPRAYRGLSGWGYCLALTLCAIAIAGLVVGSIALSHEQKYHDDDPTNDPTATTAALAANRAAIEAELATLRAHEAELAAQVAAAAGTGPAFSSDATIAEAQAAAQQRIARLETLYQRIAIAAAADSSDSDDDDEDESSSSSSSDSSEPTAADMRKRIARIIASGSVPGLIGGTEEWNSRNWIEKLREKNQKAGLLNVGSAEPTGPGRSQRLLRGFRRCFWGIGDPWTT